MTLGRCPWSIFCSRGTPPSLSPVQILQQLVKNRPANPAETDLGLRSGRTVVSSEEVRRPFRQLREVLPLVVLEPVLHVPERLLVRHQLHKPAIVLVISSFPYLNLSKRPLIHFPI